MQKAMGTVEYGMDDWGDGVDADEACDVGSRMLKVMNVCIV